MKGETSKINPYAPLCIQRPWEQKILLKKEKKPEEITKKGWKIRGKRQQSIDRKSVECERVQERIDTHRKKK